MPVDENLVVYFTIDVNAVGVSKCRLWSPSSDKSFSLLYLSPHVGSMISFTWLWKLGINKSALYVPGLN